jgi:UDP-glucuronate 4-epimerase
LKQSILVTGGAGFIGSNLIDKLLESNYKIICLDNFDSFYDESIKRKNIESALGFSNFNLITGDIRDKEILKRCFSNNDIDLVIHLAAKAGVRPSIDFPERYFDTNVMGTLQLLEVMKGVGVRRMIFASSSSIYGNNIKVPFSESDIVDNPISPYAASKKAGELLCHTFHHLYNFEIFCLRFFTVYGPRQRPDLAIHKFTNNIINNRPIELFGDGNSSRDYTYIDDIVNGIILSITHIKGYEIINLGESNTISLIQMISTLEDLLNKNAHKIIIQSQPGDVNKTYADIEKAKKLLGYSPSVEFIDGVKKFINWKLH